MRPRSCLSEKERIARSRLTKLVHDHEWIQGGLVLMKRRCGNPGCKCNRRKPHRSYYLGMRYQGKRKMVYIPGHLEERIRQWIATYKEIGQLMRVISESHSAELMRAKGQGKE